MLLAIAFSTAVWVFLMIWWASRSLTPSWTLARLKQLSKGVRPGTLDGDTDRWTSTDVMELGQRAGLSPEAVARRLGRRPWYAVAGAALGVLFGSGDPLRSAGLAAMGGLAGWWWVRLTLSREASLRQRRLEKDLPTFMDRFALSAQSGLNIRQAFRLAAQRSKGPLGHLARKVVHRMDLGATLEDALAPELAGIVPGPVRLVLSALVQAERVGAPLVKLAEEQAAFTRQLIFFRVQQSVDSLPLKMTLCGIVFLFPPVFIVLLVPNLITFLEVGW